MTSLCYIDFMFLQTPEYLILSGKTGRYTETRIYVKINFFSLIGHFLSDFFFLMSLDTFHIVSVNS